MKKFKIVNHLNFGDILLQTILWTVLTVVTAGLALPFFAYYFVRIILNTTEIHEMD
jgi:Family of unknown function (DUF6693)